MSSSSSSSSSSELPPPDLFPGFGDLVCRVVVLLGSTSMTVGELLGLRRHDILLLRQVAGEDLTVDVHGVAIARGEVAIIEDNTSLRVTEIVAPAPSEVV